MNKLVIFGFLIASVLGSITACSLPPERIDYQEVQHFEVKVTSSDLCSSCECVNIFAPGAFRGLDFVAGTFIASVDGEIFSRSVHTHTSDDGRAEFVGIVNDRNETFSEVTFGYGASK